ncbi:hypothetical protein CerSpe_171680 [Prunus speciosa]
MDSIDEIAQGISSALAISEEEAVEIGSLEELDSLRAVRFLLVGRLLTPKVFHWDSLIGTMKSIWHTCEGFTVVPLDDPQCMLFSFQNDFDRRKVMRGAPWTFDRSLLVLAFTDGSVDPMTVPLEIQHFWVRVRRIAPIFLTPALGEKIGNHLGMFVVVDKGMNEDCLGSFLRVRVGLKITDPLKRWITLRLNPDEPAKQYDIEYELLPFFCLFCGRLDHLGSSCALKMSSDVVTEQYGRWKTQIKDVFSIRVVSGSKGQAVGLGPCSRLQAQAKPQRAPLSGMVPLSGVVSLSGVVHPFEEAFDTSNGGVTLMEGEQETMVLLAAGVSKKRGIMGTEVDEHNLTKSKPTVEQQFCEVPVTTCFDFGGSSLKGLHFGGNVPSDLIENEGVGPKSSMVSSSDRQVAVGKRKSVKVGGQRARGRLLKLSAVESVGDSSLRNTAGSTGNP